MRRSTTRQAALPCTTATPHGNMLAGKSRRSLLLALAVVVGVVSFLAVSQEMRWQHKRVAERSLTRRASDHAVVEPHACGDPNERAERVLQWARDQGAHIHPNVSIGSFPLSEFPGAPKGTPHVVEIRGLRAVGSINGGHVLLSVPESLMLHVQKMEDHPGLAPVFNSTPQLHDDIGGLAVLLLTEALNRSSIFREYLCSLPEHVPLPVFYSKQRLAEMRAMLAAKQRRKFDDLVEARRDLFELHYMYLMPVLYRDYPHLFEPAVYSYERFIWAVSLVLSRTWGHKATSASGQNRMRKMRVVHALTPAADLPNHLPQAKEAEQTDDKLMLRTRDSLAPGQQVFISYGHKCDAEFLAHYGFLPFNNSHIECKEAPSMRHGSPEGGDDSEARKAAAWRKSWRRSFAMYAS